MPAMIAKSMDQGERVPSLSANLGQACYGCGETKDLSTCSGCRRVAYCGSDRQKRDWGKHKSVCNALRKLEDSGPSESLRIYQLLNSEVVGDPKVVNEFSQRCLREDTAVFEDLLGRPSTMIERNLLGWEPRCSACGLTNRMIRNLEGLSKPVVSATNRLQKCLNHNTAFFCSSEHQALVKNTHTGLIVQTTCGDLTQCEANQQARRDVLITSLHPGMVWAPERVKSRWSSIIGRTWEEEFLSEIARGLGVPAKAEISVSFLRVASQHLSVPMTILSALDQLNGPDLSWTEKNQLRIHVGLLSMDGCGSPSDVHQVIGAAELEMHCAMVFEEILHRLPRVKELEIVLYGPELSRIMAHGHKPLRIEMETCPDCRRKGRKRIHNYIPKAYHQAVADDGSGFQIPDLAAAFNSGASEIDKSLWKQTIDVLIEKAIPSVFASYNSEEAEREAEILKEAGAQLADGLGPCPNPFGSMVLKTEPGRIDGFYSVNGWLAGGFK
ncbi:hypothetical protein FA15DRAFT_217835 [Coprinopsis marcescibilis]|uniref:MYND-type domain-containing protein n=1 Tax=Coprinopsis marcescibilis TaxID=230819 RepID=A0A5C3L325_COPMA|nr:hypothetical protein FA15DRAFT_217835 [Coprinopsis marcescibilis]